MVIWPKTVSPLISGLQRVKHLAGPLMCMFNLLDFKQRYRSKNTTDPRIFPVLARFSIKAL